MIVVNDVIGNRYDDPRLGDRCAAAERDGRLETLRIPLLASQRRRLRATTDADTEIGVSIGEHARLRDGDVLVDEEGGRIVVVSLEAASELSFRADLRLPAEEAFRAGVQLGHLLGLQHWEFGWTEGLCTVQVTDRVHAEAVLRAHPVKGVSYEFRSRAEESDTRADAEGTR